MSFWHDDNRTRRSAPSHPSAPIAQRDAVYRALAEKLGISDRHRNHLTIERGIPATLQVGFATMPSLSLFERRRIAAEVAALAGCSASSVPGFYLDRSSWAPVPLPSGVSSGFLIPVFDFHGRIVGFQLRADDVRPGARRYTMFSSAGWREGSSPGTPVGVSRPDLKVGGAIITEGHLKGLIASDRLPACVLGIAGVLNWRPALDVLKGAPHGYPVTIAFDVPDLTSVLEVWRAREDLALALRARGFVVSVACWDGSKAKGVDDALLAGVPVTVESYRLTLAPAVARRSVALHLPHRATSVPLMVAAR